jgi:hypothetical protein
MWLLLLLRCLAAVGSTRLPVALDDSRLASPWHRTSRRSGLLVGAGMAFNFSQVGEPQSQLRFLMELVASGHSSAAALHDGTLAIAAQTGELARASEAMIVALRGRPTDDHMSKREANGSVMGAMDDVAAGLAAVNRDSEKHRDALSRVVLLTSQFAEYASSLLPTHHEHAAASKGKDSHRVLQSWATTCADVRSAQQVIREAKETCEAKVAEHERLDRQVLLKGDDAKPALRKQKQGAQDAAEAALQHLSLLGERVARMRQHESAAAAQVSLQMGQFEHDHVELLQLALGDLTHSHIQFHARAVRHFSLMAAECEEMRPQSIEAEVGLQTRQIAADAARAVQALRSQAEKEEKDRKEQQNG